MAKLKQSLAVLRQIPEHIRTNYPLFVEFVRAYYEHLEQTQQQDLESIHDIDTVLDEFVFKFKDEIAKNFPVEMLADKRMVMKHLREFYLSRGSENSYKFLFRVLFGKEASLFYPATEMLRVSDGRWQQDVSIFVLSATGSVFNATGKYVYVTNSRGKKIRTYCESTVQYNTQICEVFISRDYINELNIGASVFLEDGTLLGTILPCPSKFNIYKPGSGFKVGDIFSLKTQIGRGCIVKVTKVGSIGEIKKLQIIKFGLDYETKFYSYLSSKTDVAYEYIHPLKLASGSQHTDTYDIAAAGSATYQIDYIISGGNPLVIVEIVRNDTLLYQHEFSYTTSITGGTSYVTVNDLQVGDKLFVTGITELASNPAPPIPNPEDPSSPNYLNEFAPRTRYTDPTDGFVDYGWASKQTYFYYDTTIPVGDESYASDRFYAESGYVGEVVQQFYADATSKPIDETLAIIEVELGAVAKYSGYFNTANGFISDEMFIQDGNYYQAFSYVIKVEEELRRYADIVKALVHPAGMKLFSEYNIYNELQLSYIQPKAFITLQLPLFDHEQSNSIILDQGYAYADILNEDGELIQSAYTTTLNENGQITIVENIAAARVYAQQGKASLFNIKSITDISSPVTDNVNTKYVEKFIADSIIENYDEKIAKDTHKKIGIDDFTTDNVTTPDAGYGLDAEGNIVLSDPGKLAWMNFKLLTEAVLNTETYPKALDKLITELATISHDYVNELKALKTETITTPDAGYGLDADGNKVYSEAGMASLQPDLGKDETAVISHNYVNELKPVKVETITTPEEYFNELKALKTETITTPDAGYGLDANGNKVYADAGKASLNPDLGKAETAVISHNYVNEPKLEKADAISTPDAYFNELKPVKTETVEISHDYVNELKPVKTETITTPEEYFNELKALKTETATTPDAYFNDPNLIKVETVEISHDYVNELKPVKVESISAELTLFEILRVKFVEELINLIEAYSNEPNLIKDELITISHNYVNEAKLGPSESINSTMNGRVRLNSYDSEQYTAFTEDYQNETASVVSLT